MPLSPKLKSWNEEVMKHFNAAKNAGKPIKLGQAMKMAKKTYKKTGGGNNNMPMTRKNRKGSRKNRSTRKN
jgi:hypothetical protein